MPNNVSNVGFQNPGFDYGADLSRIERSRALAAQLQQHSMEQDPTQSVGGWAIKQSPWSGLAKALQGGAAGYVHSRADQQQRDLSTKAQQDYQQMLAKGIGQLQGTPGSPMPSAELGGGPEQPSAQPDPAGAMGTFGSHPMGAPMMPLAMQQVQLQQRRQMLAEALKGGGQQQSNPMAQGGSSVMAGGGSQQAPQQQGGFGAGIPPQIMALMSSGDPELVGIGKALLEANKGVAQRPGAPVVNPFTGAVIAQPTPAVPPGVGLQVGPGGPQAYPVPGAQGAMAGLTQSQAGATEAGKAPYQLSTYNTPGSPRVMTHQQAIEGATGQPMPQPGQSQQPQQQPAGPQGLPPNVPPQDASAFQYVQDQARQGRTASAMGNSQYAGPRAPGMPLQDQGESASQQHAGAEVGKFFGDTYAQLQRGAIDAGSKLTKLSRMESLLKDVETGKLTPAATNVAGYAKSLGFDIDPTLDNKQAAEALTNEIALQARNPSGGAGMPGALSDSDRNFLSSMTPGLAKTPGARESIMDTSRKLAKRDQEVAKLARDYYKNHGNTLDNGFFEELQNFSNANPLFKEVPQTFAEGQTATGPGGVRIVHRNGKWERM